MRSSYKESDVIFLLKDITGMVNPQPTEEREKLIQAGKHYCEMLPIEYVPSEKYMEIYKGHAVLQPEGGGALQLFPDPGPGFLQFLPVHSIPLF